MQNTKEITFSFSEITKAMIKRKDHKSFGPLEHLRKPHGILILDILVGIIAWAAWTFFVAKNA
jgi:hypothetical protein